MRRSVLVVALMLGCSNAPAPVEELPQLKQILQPQPQNGYQIVLPVVKGLASGSDTEICTWTHLIVDKQTDVRAVEAYQTVGGHHIVMFTTQKTLPPGTTRVCTDSDMATFRFGAGAGAEGMGSKVTAPGDLVFRIPAGSQIVLNHHYINATPGPLDSQSAMNIWLADPTQKYTPSGSMAVLDTSFKLAPGPATVDVNCTLPHAVKVWEMFPHMHAYGTRAVIQHIHGDTTDTLFDVQPWSPAYAFHPPTFNVDPAKAVALDAGDALHVHCEWNNTLSTPITFGIEMCVGFVQFVDDANIGNIECDHGQWGTF